MTHLELMTVEHTVFISRPGGQMLVLSPRFRMPKSWSKRGWAERQEQVTVIRPDASSLMATATNDGQNKSRQPTLKETKGQTRAAVQKTRDRLGFVARNGQLKLRRPRQLT